MGKSMVGLEGKYEGWEKVWRVLVVYGDRGYTYEWLVKIVGNCVLCVCVCVCVCVCGKGYKNKLGWS